MKPQTGKVLMCGAVLMMLATSQGVSAEGLRGGFDDAFGPQFHPQSPSRIQRNRNIAPATGWIKPPAFAIGTRSPSTPAASITRRSRRQNHASLANNLGQAVRAGRCPSSISPSSKP